MLKKLQISKQVHPLPTCSVIPPEANRLRIIQKRALLPPAIGDFVVNCLHLHFAAEVVLVPLETCKLCLVLQCSQNITTSFLSNLKSH